VAKPMGSINKGTNNKTSPTKHQAKTKEKNPDYTQLNSNTDSPREDESLPTKI
jgi:hypothetical protein